MTHFSDNDLFPPLADVGPPGDGPAAPNLLGLHPGCALSTLYPAQDGYRVGL